MFGLAMLAMAWGDWTLFVLATVVAGMVVERLKVSNWYMLVAVPAVWGLCYVVILVLKLAVLMIPLIVVGCVVYYLLHKTALKR